MKLETKISGGAVMLLALLAGLMLLMEHVRTSTLRTATSGQQAASAPPLTRPRAPAIAPSFARLRPGAALIVPVRGVETAALVDTWGAARSQGRTHQGIDILAPAGTPVLAAESGQIKKFFDSERGGITIYQYDSAQNYVLYYAHLSARAPGLMEGAYVNQGDVIGFVGQTGNATTPHLHFEIGRLGADKRWWTAEALNPYTYLIRGQAP